jgi:hypothetical protein
MLQLVTRLLATDVGMRLKGIAVGDGEDVPATVVVGTALVEGLRVGEVVAGTVVSTVVAGTEVAMVVAGTVDSTVVTVVAGTVVAMVVAGTVDSTVVTGLLVGSYVGKYVGGYVIDILSCILPIDMDEDLAKSSALSSRATPMKGSKFSTLPVEPPLKWAELPEEECICCVRFLIGGAAKSLAAAPHIAWERRTRSS